jgi:hypothetical protein
MSDVLIYHAPIEILESATGSMSIMQLPVEVLRTGDASITATRIVQLPIEWLMSNQNLNSSVVIHHAPIEVITNAIKPRIESVSYCFEVLMVDGFGCEASQSYCLNLAGTEFGAAIQLAQLPIEICYTNPNPS